MRGSSGKQALLARLEALRGEPESGARGKIAIVRLRKLAPIREMFGDPAVAQLREVAADRLAAATGVDGFVADLGAGTYGLVWQDDNRDPRDATERVVAEVSRPVAFGAVMLHAPANAGVCAMECGSFRAEEVLERAMRALEQAMARGPGAIEWASERRIGSEVDDWQMRGLLEEAALRGEMSLEYQRLHTAAGDPLLRLEALLRWDNPALGRTSPARFVPILEETGLIRPLGEWVLREACMQVRDWRERTGAPVCIAVNVSPVQLAASDFVDVARRTLAQTACKAQWLELEITEGAVVRDLPSMRAQLEALQDLGFHLAIDDFGAGYSSLGQLAQLPFHHLKMDRSLTAGLPDTGKRSGIVKAVIALADALDLRITAEGVERREQADWLAAYPRVDCQGFFFSRPVPPAEALRGLDPDARATGGALVS